MTTDKIRIFTRPTGLHSRAMVRVADALERYAPSNFTFSGSPSANYSDLVVLHAIGSDAIEAAASCKARGQKYVLIQYCLQTSGATVEEWVPCWRDAALVWSYYDLAMMTEHVADEQFYHSPLGVTTDFYEDDTPKEPLVITIGYVNGPGAEEIEAVWDAADKAGIQFFHIGPRNVSGASRVPNASQVAEGITEEVLIQLYRRATWVAGLRHVEGFELPALEGYMCGAVPIMFEQPVIRQWYGEAPYYVSEDWRADTVTKFLAEKFRYPAVRSSLPEPHTIYLWKSIIRDFYAALEGAL